VAITHVQDGTQATITASGVTANLFSANVIAGNAVSFAAFGAAGTTAFSAASGLGITTFTKAVGSHNSGFECELWTGFSSAGGSKALTLTGQQWYAGGSEWAGATSAGTFTGATGTSTAPAVSPSPAAGNAVFCAMALASSGSTASPTSPWTSTTAVTGFDFTWQIVASGGSVTATWTALSQAWDCMGIVLIGGPTALTSALTASAAVAATNTEAVTLTLA